MLSPVCPSLGPMPPAVRKVGGWFMPDAIAYVRVSTDEQAASGLGLDAQRDAIRGAAEARGLTIVHWCADEGISGAAPIEDRPGLIEAMERIRGAAVLLVAKRDRLSRDMLMSLWIEKEVARANAEIVSASGEGNGSSPTDILMRRIVDAFAEYERAMIRARTRGAIASAKASGRYMGGHAPYGYDVNGQSMAPNPHEQAGIAEIKRLRRAGKGWKRIAKLMDEGGWTSKGGGKWSPTTVKRIWEANRLR